MLAYHGTSFYTMSFKSILLGLITCLLCHGITVASSESANFVEEYELKAVFLYNLGKFVRWPSTAFTDPSDSLKICVLGQDPFEKSLEASAKVGKINNREVEIRRLNHVKQSNPCHILFISSSEKNHLANIFAYLRSYPILTVGDVDGFITAGGMVKFYLYQERIRLAINVTALKNTGLQADANLLRIARIVTAENGE